MDLELLVFKAWKLALRARSLYHSVAHTKGNWAMILRKFLISAVHQTLGLELFFSTLYTPFTTTKHFTGRKIVAIKRLLVVLQTYEK